jgi:hypothetical protein
MYCDLLENVTYQHKLGGYPRMGASMGHNRIPSRIWLERHRNNSSAMSTGTHPPTLKSQNEIPVKIVTL